MIFWAHEHQFNTVTKKNLNTDFMKIILKLSKCNCKYSSQSLPPFALYCTRCQKLSFNTTSLWKDSLFWIMGLCLQDGKLLLPGALGEPGGQVPLWCEVTLLMRTLTVPCVFFFLFLSPLSFPSFSQAQLSNTKMLASIQAMVTILPDMIVDFCSAVTP